MLHFTSTSQPPCDLSIVIPISQIRKLKPVEVHLQLANIQAVWSLNLDPPPPKFGLSTTALDCTNLKTEQKHRQKGKRACK